MPEHFVTETSRLERKAARITIRLRPSSLMELRSAAREYGMEPTRFARRLILIGLRKSRMPRREKHTNHV